MFKFEAKQVVYDIGGVKIGGDASKNPTVMIGSIFYKGDKSVKDEETGVFDKERMLQTISKMEETSERTGLPAMLDVICTNAENAAAYLEFAADATDMPLLIDAVSEEAAIKGMECAKELGIIDKTVLNSLTPDTKEPVYRKIKETGLETAIILTYSARAIISSSERIKILETLVPKAQTWGIKKPLIDTVVMDIATLGLACKAIREVKNRFGYPAGCGAHNAISSWRALKQKKNKILTLVCSAIANGLPVTLGADFVLFGPAKEAEWMFPAISIINAAYGQVSIEEGVRPSPSHPRFKVSRL